MKNLKCVIGATILTPVVIACIVGLILGIAGLSMWIQSIPFLLLLIEICKYIFTAFGVMLVLFVIWFMLYEHCMKRSKK